MDSVDLFTDELWIVCTVVIFAVARLECPALCLWNLSGLLLNLAGTSKPTGIYDVSFSARLVRIALGLQNGSKKRKRDITTNRQMRELGNIKTSHWRDLPRW